MLIINSSSSTYLKWLSLKSVAIPVTEKVPALFQQCPQQVTHFLPFELFLKSGLKFAHKCQQLQEYNYDIKIKEDFMQLGFNYSNDSLFKKG